MNDQITCDIRRGLIPLVRDGVASKTAVREHIKNRIRKKLKEEGLDHE